NRGSEHVGQLARDYIPVAIDRAVRGARDGKEGQTQTEERFKEAHLFHSRRPKSRPITSPMPKQASSVMVVGRRQVRRPARSACKRGWGTQERRCISNLTTD